MIEPDEVARLAGIRSIEALARAFTDAYPDAGDDFWWTWLLRRGLAAAARQRGIGAVAVGANREDLLSEGLLRLARGMTPLPAPYRPIGDVTFVYPMWTVPKKIGDGAFVSMSLDNYQRRTPSPARGRSAFYHLAYVLADHLPGMDMTLLRGFAGLAATAARQQPPIGLDPEIDDHAVLGAYSPAERDRWAAVLASVRA